MAAEKTSLEERVTLTASGNSQSRPWRRLKRWLLGLPLVLALLGAGGYFGMQWWWYTTSHVSTDDARVKGTLITISTEVPGRLIAIAVEEGQSIRKGDLLAQIQPEEYAMQVVLREATLEAVRSQLASAAADLELARTLVEGQVQRSDAALGTSRSQLVETEKTASFEDHRTQANKREKEAAVEESKARLVGTKAALDKAIIDRERAMQLFRDGIFSEAQREQAVIAYDQAAAQHHSTQEALHKAQAVLQMAHAESHKVQLSLTSVRTQQGKVRESEAVKALAMAERQRLLVKEEAVKDLQAKVKEAEAQLALARLRLTETHIVSPIAGVVSQKIADPGERVQPGQPIMVINDPNDVWISANIEETAIRKVQLAHTVEIEADAYPQRRFYGTVSQLGAATRSEFAIIPTASASAHFIKVTQRIPVRITVDNNEGLLKPGMMVEVSIRVR